MLSKLKKKPEELALIANSLRQDVVRMLVASQSGHTAGSLGMADVFATLYFSIAHLDPKKPEHPDRDIIFLSNGHICPVLYASLAHRGFFSRKELLTFRKLGSRLQGHPHVGSLPGVENSGGPLGQGLSQSCGAALGLLRDSQEKEKKKRKKTNQQRVFCFAGDGELNEGQAWEAAMFAANHKLRNLTWIIDRNNIQIDGFSDNVMNLCDLGQKFSSFGWHVIRVSGHDIYGLVEAFSLAEKTNKPSVIIAHTIPGRGVREFENDFHWHGKAPSVEQGKQALKELEEAKSFLTGKHSWREKK